MAKKECENCGKIVRSGFFSSSEEINGKFLCSKCIELQKNNFFEHVKPKLSSKLKIESLELPNVPFIKYSEEFFKKNKRAIKKTKDGSEGFYYRNEMDIKKLYEIYTMFANFDIINEIPLFYYRYGGTLSELESILITNLKIYYNLLRSKKDSSDYSTGSINLESITSTEAKPSSLLFAGLKGIQIELYINGQLLGAFNVYSKKTGRLVNDYLSALAFRNQEMIVDRQQSVQSANVGNHSDTDIATKLNQLKGLLDNGILTEEEFNAKKKELIERM